MKLVAMMVIVVAGIVFVAGPAEVEKARAVLRDIKASSPRGTCSDGDN